MSLLKLYGNIALAPIAISVALFPYNIYKSLRSKNIAWNEKDTLKNFTLISNAKPNEIKMKICPKQFFNLVPYIHQGNLGYNTKKEADEAIHSFIEITSIAVGVAVASIPVIRFFHKCLSDHGPSGLGTCVFAASNDLLSYAGLPLLAGAYFTSRLAKYILIGPVVWMTSTDQFEPVRVKLLTAEYGKMVAALNTILDKPAEDPKFIEIAQNAKLFLRLTPHIEKELHNSLSLDRIQAKEALISLRMVCQQFLAKQAQAARLAKVSAPAIELAKPATAPVKV